MIFYRIWLRSVLTIWYHTNGCGWKARGQTGPPSVCYRFRHARSRPRSGVRHGGDCHAGRHTTGSKSFLRTKRRDLKTVVPGLHPRRSMRMWSCCRSSSRSRTSSTKKMSKTMWAQFWSAHSRFFNYFFVASKVGILKCEMFLTTAGNQKCLCFCLSCLPPVPKIRC